MQLENLLNDRAKELKQGGIRAFFDKGIGIEDLVNLGIGEPDFHTPRPIVDEAYKHLLNGKTHYSANAGDIGTREAVAGFLTRYGLSYDPKTEIIMTPGGMGALSLALLCLLAPGDEVLIQDPQWLNYNSQVKFCGGTPVPVPVYEEDAFALKVEELEKAVTAKTKILMVNSPNNPTGAVIPKEQLQAIADFAVKHDLLVISDEVYSELLYDGNTHCSIASFPGMKERTLVINSFSKPFAMTGWRLGYTAGPQVIIKKMTVLQENVSACASMPAQAVAKFTLETLTGLAEMKEQYEKRRILMWEGLNQIDGISCIKPVGAFYLFPNISSFGLSSEEFALRLMQEGKVTTIPGSAFGAHGEGYLRVSYANTVENLEKALERIAAFVKKLG